MQIGWLWVSWWRNCWNAGTYSKGKFDIAGFSLGLVEKDKILINKIRENDLVVAIPSNGLHSNGFSLVRHVLKKKKLI